MTLIMILCTYVSAVFIAYSVSAITNSWNTKEMAAQRNLVFNLVILIPGGLVTTFLSIAPILISLGVLKTEDEKTKNGPEYELNIINENKIQIKNTTSGKVYYPKWDRIDDVLLKDNL